MSFNYVSDDLDDIHRIILETLVDGNHDFESAPRGRPIKEMIAASFTLTNPRNRIIFSPTRSVNYGFAVGELCWYLRGDTDLETMQYYNKRMSQFSDDGKTINSAYGARLLNDRWVVGSASSDRCRSQFDNIIDEFKHDPDSRRAVMHINEPGDLLSAVQKGSKDVPCTMSLQLFIRNRRLHMHVLMRSNDVVWGMPYDVFSFTCLQECFLYMLQNAGVPVDDLGEYHHTAGSLHIYDTHYDMALKVSGERYNRPTQMKPFELAKMQELAQADEPSIRNDEWSDLIACRNASHDENPIDWMFGMLVRHKNKRIEESVRRNIASADMVTADAVEELKK